MSFKRPEITVLSSQTLTQTLDFENLAMPRRSSQTAVFAASAVLERARGASSLRVERRSQKIPQRQILPARYRLQSLSCVCIYNIRSLRSIHRLTLT